MPSAQKSVIVPATRRGIPQVLVFLTRPQLFLLPKFFSSSLCDEIGILTTFREE